MSKSDNKSFVFKSLQALEDHGKIREIFWLSESYFCEKELNAPLKDELGKARPILLLLLPDSDENLLRKDTNDYDRYYKSPIILDGIKFLVLNHWTDDLKCRYFAWLKSIISFDSAELSELEKLFERKK
ncbi:MAG: hypothetical protein J6U56_08775 [Spirochaetia bacterium]|nr:hypothetical protein [Spirochaetia bacterium]